MTDQTNAVTRANATHHTYVRDWLGGDNENNPVIVIVEIDYNHPEPFEDAYTRVLATGAKHCTNPDGSRFADGEAFEDATQNTLHLLGDVSAMLEVDYLWADLAFADGPVWSGHTNVTGEWCRFSGKRVVHDDPQDRCPDQCRTAIRVDGPAGPPAAIDINRVGELLADQGITCHTVGVAGGRIVLVTFHGDLPVVRLAERPGEPGWAMVADRPGDTEVTLWASGHDTTNVIAAAVMAEQHRAMVRYAAERRER